MKNPIILLFYCVTFIILITGQQCQTQEQSGLPETDEVKPEAKISITYKNNDGIETTEEFTNVHTTFVLEDAAKVFVPKENDYLIVFSATDNTAILALKIKRVKLTAPDISPENLPEIYREWNEANANSFRNHILTGVRHTYSEIWYTLTAYDYHGNTDTVGYICVNNAL